MCQQDFDIHFCTCDKTKARDARILEAQKAYLSGKYEEKHFVWVLRHLEPCKEYFTMGSILKPKNQLSEELTAAVFLKALNENKHFDFEYTPQEKDEFEVAEEYRFQQLDGRDRPWFINKVKFKHENSKWNINLKNLEFGPHFERLVDYKKGKMEIKKKPND